MGDDLDPVALGPVDGFDQLLCDGSLTRFIAAQIRRDYGAGRIETEAQPLAGSHGIVIESRHIYRGIPNLRCSLGETVIFHLMQGAIALETSQIHI